MASHPGSEPSATLDTTAIPTTRALAPTPISSTPTRRHGSRANHMESTEIVPSTSSSPRMSSSRDCVGFFDRVAFFFFFGFEALSALPFSACSMRSAMSQEACARDSLLSSCDCSDRPSSVHRKRWCPSCRRPMPSRPRVRSRTSGVGLGLLFVVCGARCVSPPRTRGPGHTHK